MEAEGKVAPVLGDMDKDDFRRFGHELIDWIADYFERIEDLPVLAQIEPGDLKHNFQLRRPRRAKRWMRLFGTSIA